MTPTQLQALATFVNGQASLKQFLIDGADNKLTTALNAVATPDFWVYRTQLFENDITTGTAPDVAQTQFSWTALIARSAGEQFGWARMFAMGSGVDPSKSNIRQAFADIFSGAQNGAPNQRLYLGGIARRLATLAEKTLAVLTVRGAGEAANSGALGSTTSVATMTFEGAVSDSDTFAIAVALGLR